MATVGEIGMSGTRDNQSRFRSLLRRSA